MMGLLVTIIAFGAASAGSLPSFFVSSTVSTGYAVGTAGYLLAAGSVLGLAVRLVLGWWVDRRPALRLPGLATMFIMGAFGYLFLSFGSPMWVILGGIPRVRGRVRVVGPVRPRRRLHQSGHPGNRSGHQSDRRLHRGCARSFVLWSRCEPVRVLCGLDGHVRSRCGGYDGRDRVGGESGEVLTGAVPARAPPALLPGCADRTNEAASFSRITMTHHRLSTTKRGPLGLASRGPLRLSKSERPGVLP